MATYTLAVALERDFSEDSEATAAAAAEQHHPHRRLLRGWQPARLLDGAWGASCSS